MSKSRNQKNMRRYHYQVYFPEQLGQMCIEFISQMNNDPGATIHAADQMLCDKRGIIPLPTKAELFHPENTLVELYELLDENNNPSGTIQKMVIRIHNMNDDVDYSYVIARENFIVSCWANDKNDNHRLTESEEQYYQP